MFSIKMLNRPFIRRHFDFASVLCKSTRSNLKIKESVESPNEVFTQVLNNTQPKTVKEWNAIRKQVLDRAKLFTPESVDFLTMAFCLSTKNYPLGKSYINFLDASNIKPNLAASGRFFALFYASNKFESIPKEDEEYILKLYTNIKKSYEVLDSITCENALLAISLTKNWKECLKLFDDIKYTCPIPAALTYSALVAALFRNNEPELAWKFLNEMIENGRLPYPEVYSAYIKLYNKNRDALEKLFSFLQLNDIKLDNETAIKLKETLESNFKVSLTSISNSGTCKVCRNKLQTVHVTKEEFDTLKKQFFENVIIGKNVFYKTNPKELNRFKEFIANMGKFDVVVDGLNVAYSSGMKPPMITSGLVAAVVRHFVQQNKKVLVLGRSHMNKWPKRNLSYIASNASLFLAEDLSQDDPYLLYCALSCGMNTIIVSRDLMRSHIFLLKTPYYKNLFKRWFLQNQYMLLHVNEKGKALFKVPLSYATTAQKIGNTWHIPYNTVKESVNCLEWFCISI